MRNEDFKQLVALLESDPEVLHGFLMKGTSKPEVDALLSDYCRAFAANTPAPAKLLNALFKEEVDKANLMEAVAACVASCEGSRLGTADFVADPRWAAQRFAAAGCTLTEQCDCSNGSTCTASCGVTMAADVADKAVDPRWAPQRFAAAAAGCGSTCVVSCEVTTDRPPRMSAGAANWAVDPAWGASPRWPGQRFTAAGCDANSTCSCTSGTCGGVTCGGSTCSATCTGDSCGNTCGDSCGHTTNLTRPFEVVRWWRQTDFWR